MITEIVTFDLPRGITRDEVLEKYNATVPRWRANADLLRKTYLFDADSGTGGGVYLWKSKAAAQDAHDAEWCRMAQQVYGSHPRFAFFEAVLEINNTD